MERSTVGMRCKPLITVALAAAAFAAASTAMADQVVKIGSVEPTTGGISHLGKDNENGARLAVEEINAKATIGGKKITLQLDAQDDAADPRPRSRRSSSTTRSSPSSAT